MTGWVSARPSGLGEQQAVIGIQRTDVPPSQNGIQQGSQAPPAVSANPHDIADTGEVRTVHAFHAGDLSFDVPEQVADAGQTRTFFQGHQDMPANSVSRSGEHFVIRAGNDAIRVGRGQLEQMFRQGQLRGDSVLARSLFVAEMSINTSLPASAQRAIFRGFVDAVQSGMPAEQAMIEAQMSAVLASEVETYATVSLPQDIRAIGSFTRQAQSGQAMQRGLGALGNNAAARQQAIQTAQQILDEGLHGFTEALGRARESGDYAQAFDALQTFVQRGATITESPVWQQRIEARSGEVEASQGRQGPVPSALMDAASNPQVPEPAEAYDDGVTLVPGYITDIDELSSGAEAYDDGVSLVPGYLTDIDALVGADDGYGLDAEDDEALDAADDPASRRFVDPETGLELQKLGETYEQLERDVIPADREVRRIDGHDVEVHRKRWQTLDQMQGQVVRTERNQNYTQYHDAQYRQRFEVSQERIQNDESGQENVALRQGGNAFANSTNMFVMDRDGSLYAANFQEQSGKSRGMHLHHSSFLSGQPVAGAGEIHLDSHGAVKLVNNQSGHYRPGAEQTRQTLEKLAVVGVNLNNVRLDNWDASGRTSGMATEFLRGGRTGEEQAAQFSLRHAVTGQITDRGSEMLQRWASRFEAMDAQAEERAVRIQRTNVPNVITVPGYINQDDFDQGRAAPAPADADLPNGDDEAIQDVRLEMVYADMDGNEIPPPAPQAQTLEMVYTDMDGNPLPE